MYRLPSPRQLSVLLDLAHYPGEIYSVRADRLGLPAASVCSDVSYLESKGFVVRDEVVAGRAVATPRGKQLARLVGLWLKADEQEAA